MRTTSWIHFWSVTLCCPNMSINSFGRRVRNKRFIYLLLLQNSEQPYLSSLHLIPHGKMTDGENRIWCAYSINTCILTCSMYALLSSSWPWQQCQQAGEIFRLAPVKIWLQMPPENWFYFVLLQVLHNAADSICRQASSLQGRRYIPTFMMSLLLLWNGFESLVHCHCVSVNVWYCS